VGSAGGWRQVLREFVNRAGGNRHVQARRIAADAAHAPGQPAPFRCQTNRAADQADADDGERVDLHRSTASAGSAPGGPCPAIVAKIPRTISSRLPAPTSHAACPLGRYLPLKRAAEAIEYFRRSRCSLARLL